MAKTNKMVAARAPLPEETRYGWYRALRDGEEISSGPTPLSDEVLAQAHEVHWLISDPAIVVLPPEVEPVA